MSAKLNNQSKHKENRLFCVLNKRIRTIRSLLLLLAVAAATLRPSEIWADEVMFLNSCTPATCDATPITNSLLDVELTGGGGWYYVNGVVAISGDLKFSSAANLILCDGAKLTITGKLDATAICIYSQSYGNEMGELCVNTEGSSTIQSANSDLFQIEGGKLSVKGSLFASSMCRLDGGQVTATGISSPYLYIDFKSGSDFYHIDSYNTTSTFFSSKTETDDDPPLTYYEPITDSTPLNGKTLRPLSSNVYNVTVPAASVGGTVTANMDKFLWRGIYESYNVTFNFTPAAGYLLTSASWNDGSDHDIPLASLIADAYSQTISSSAAHDLTVSATFATPVKAAYVGADGKLHDGADMATAYPLSGTETQLGSATSGETWYVTTSETATFTNTITLNGDVHIILANGTTMNVGTSESPIAGSGIASTGSYNYNLSIHGQENRTGKLNVEASGYGIYSYDMNIYGAEVMAKSTSQDAIHADNDMTIFDSKVTATGGNFGIYAETYMNITGGQVKTEGGSTSDGMIYGINCPINLTWKKSSDYLQSKGYGDDLTIAKGQYFYMTEVDTYGKQNPISGTISEGSINEDIPIGAKLVPALPVQGGSPYVGFFMTSGGWSLPGGVKAFTPQGYNLAAGTASLAEISGVPDGKTVILGSATDGGNLPSTFYLIGTTVENAASYESSYQANPFQSNFKTSETGLTLGEMIGDTDENTALILSDGSFKSFNYPSSLSQRPDPQHVFLIVSKWDMLTKGSSSNGGSSGARSIGIDTGATTGIKLTPVLSEGDGVWYSLDGRKLSVKPAAKGVYINKGKKYVVR